MKQYKVYGGNRMDRGVQVRVIIATTSMAKAALAAGVSLGYVKTYWSVTGNEKEISMATAKPDTLIICERL